MTSNMGRSQAAVSSLGDEIDNGPLVLTLL
jgi:hypothetical protein